VTADKVARIRLIAVAMRAPRMEGKMSRPRTSFLAALAILIGASMPAIVQRRMSAFQQSQILFLVPRNGVSLHRPQRRTNAGTPPTSRRRTVACSSSLSCRMETPPALPTTVVIACGDKPPAKLISIGSDHWSAAQTIALSGVSPAMRTLDTGAAWREQPGEARPQNRSASTMVSTGSLALRC
jgi:hypothetical protein